MATATAKPTGTKGKVTPPWEGEETRWPESKADEQGQRQRLIARGRAKLDAKREAASIAHSLLCDLIAHDYAEDHSLIATELRRIADTLRQRSRATPLFRNTDPV